MVVNNVIAAATNIQGYMLFVSMIKKLLNTKKFSAVKCKTYYVPSFVQIYTATLTFYTI